MELNIELPRVSGGPLELNIDYRESPVSSLELNIELPRVLGGPLELNIELPRVSGVLIEVEYWATKGLGWAH